MQHGVLLLRKHNPSLPWVHQTNHALLWIQVALIYCYICVLLSVLSVEYGEVPGPQYRF